MSERSRRKGAAFENEVCIALSEILGEKVTRRLGQPRDGGEDIRVNGYVIECKRRASLTTLESWYSQVKSATNPSGAEIPIVVMRADNGQAMVLLSFDDFFKRHRGEAVVSDV